MKAKLLFIILVFYYSCNALSQVPNWLWAKSIGSLGTESGQGITADQAGNVYTTGWFSGNVDFDPGPSSYYLNGFGNGNIFISKLDNSGNFIWARSLGVNGNNFGMSIALDQYANVYVTGGFSDSIDVDPGPGEDY